MLRRKIIKKNNDKGRYIISTLCIGQKYIPILKHWRENLKKKCKDFEIKIITEKETSGIHIWYDRLLFNYNLLLEYNKDIIMCDLDCIIRNDIKPLLEIEGDIIVSKEIGGKKAYPQEYSSNLGFGVCCGFMILKKNSEKIINNILENNDKSNFDDQVNLMKYLVNCKNKEIYEKDFFIEEKKYKNIIIELKDEKIKIVVLDFELVIRDPINSGLQFADHINIDNVRGAQNFINYFYKDLEVLPLTCRCGRKDLGDFNICTHVRKSIK